MHTKKDLEMLTTLAELRLAPAIQLAGWLGITEQMIRRRARKLAGKGLLQYHSRENKGGPGRPDSVFSLSGAGAAALQEEKILPAGVPPERAVGESMLPLTEHQILLNWVHLHLRLIQKADRGLSVRFLSSTSPFNLSHEGRTILSSQVSFPAGKVARFVPDASFCLTHHPSGKNLLFFVEVDMGTETVADPQGKHGGDVQGKIIVYRTFLGGEGYKRFESDALFGVPFKGFRMLLVSSTPQRADTLARLVWTNKPSDFIWTTHLSLLLELGVWSKIWRRGGNPDPRLESIMGGCEEDLCGLVPPSCNGA